MCLDVDLAKGQVLETKKLFQYPCLTRYFLPRRLYVGNNSILVFAVGPFTGPQNYCFSPTAKLAMGSLAQNSSGAIRSSCNPRFRRRFRRVPESSRGFRCRKLMRFRTVPVQKADEVPDGSGADG